MECDSPLRLENVCRINLLFRLEEYPVQQLLLLPFSIRRNLSLSPVDFLHYKAAGLFQDFDTADLVKSARQKLLNLILGTRCSDPSTGYNTNLTSLIAPVVSSVLATERPERELSESTVIEHIESQAFSSLPFKRWITSGPIILFPNRFSSFVTLQCFPSIESFELLLQYCHFLKAPKEVKIDIYGFFLSSIMWIIFEDNIGVLKLEGQVLPCFQLFAQRIVNW